MPQLLLRDITIACIAALCGVIVWRRAWHHFPFYSVAQFTCLVLALSGLYAYYSHNVTQTEYTAFWNFRQQATQILDIFCFLECMTVAALHKECRDVGFGLSILLITYVFMKFIPYVQSDVTEDFPQLVIFHAQRYFNLGVIIASGIAISMLPKGELYETLFKRSS